MNRLFEVTELTEGFGMGEMQLSITVEYLEARLGVGMHARHLALRKVSTKKKKKEPA